MSVWFEWLGQVTGSTPIEVIALIGAFLILSAWAFSSGTATLGAFSSSLLISALSISYFPGTLLIGGLYNPAPSAWLSPGALFVLCAIIFFLLTRRIFSDDAYDNGNPIVSAIAALATMGIMLAIWARTPALLDLYAIPSLVAPYFMPAYTLLWIVGGLVALAMFRQTRFW
ncbi:MAG: hypothetical protein AAB421_03235 [Patescibacteria group bacterium]